MKRILVVIFIIAGLIIINNLLHSVYNLWQKKDLLAKAQKQLVYQKEENMRLKSQTSVVESQEFIEKEARDKLLWVKQGEQQVIVPKDLLKGKPAKEENKGEPNWNRWLKLFF